MALEIAACAVGGGLASLLILAAFDPFGQASDLDAITILVGAVVGVGLNRFVRS